MCARKIFRAPHKLCICATAKGCACCEISRWAESVQREERTFFIVFIVDSLCRVQLRWYLLRRRHLLDTFPHIGRPRRRRWFSLQQKTAVSRRTDEGSAVTVVPRLLWISRRTWASFRFSCRPPSHSTMYLSRPVVASCFQWVTFPSTIAVSASSP